MRDTALMPVGTHSFLDENTYRSWYQASIDTPTLFWSEQATKWVDWIKPWTTVCKGELAKGNVRWFDGAELNMSYNCLDRHLPAKADQIALLWEGDLPHEHCQLTYQALYEAVCRFANVLKQYGIKKHDKVCIYLPMVPEAVIAMLACARIGAVHSVVFAGFSAEALKTRILDADCHLLITANVSLRGGKTIPLKENADLALASCPDVKKVIVVKRQEHTISWHDQRDVWFHEAMKNVSADCPIEIVKATDPLFILYTSGSTGTPKGILHAVGGYAVHVAMSFKIIFDYREGDVFWCTADVGWITGHSYVVYGPLMNGATTLIFEGAPHYPSFSRYWELIDKYKVNIFYTAPTAIRALRREGDEWVQQSSTRQSLRLLGSVGEPINPDAWEWYYRVVGDKRCPIVDTWWQTETGGIMLSAIPYVTPLKPGSAAWPFFGVNPCIVDAQGEKVTANTMGNLVIQQPWPGMLQTIYGNEERFLNAYLRDFPGWYVTGDEAYQDEEGYHWIAGRTDDVIKVSGHRIGSQEVESALIHHEAVSESAVVAIEDEIKGHAIYAFVALKQGYTGSEQLKAALIQEVRDSIGAIAAPHCITWVDALPKTRSGKIMRRILKKIANGERENLGDLSTLADPDVVKSILKKIPQ